ARRVHELLLRDPRDMHVRRRDDGLLAGHLLRRNGWLHLPELHFGHVHVRPVPDHAVRDELLNSGGRLDSMVRVESEMGLDPHFIYDPATVSSIEGILIRRLWREATGQARAGREEGTDANYRERSGEKRLFAIRWASTALPRRTPGDVATPSRSLD